MKFVEVLGGPVVEGAALVAAVGQHGPPLYSRALYNNLPDTLKRKMPDPPTK